MGDAFLSSYTGRGLSCHSVWCFFGGRSRQAVNLSYQRLSVSDPCMEVSGIVWSMAGLLHLDFLVLWVGSRPHRGAWTAGVLFIWVAAMLMYLG